MRRIVFALGMALGLAGCTLVALPDESLVDDGSGAAGAADEGGAGGAGGAGGQTECIRASDCPSPDAQPCVEAVCDAGRCGTRAVAAGAPLPESMAGDCARAVCDGRGTAITEPDDDDVPVDGEACTLDVCTAGVPSNPDAEAGAPCGAGLVCDGMGACTGCTSPSQCPGQDGDCQTRTCEAAVCGLHLEATGEACDEDGGSVCDGAGACAQCVTAADCPPSTECLTFTCSAGSCAGAPAPLGAPVSAQVAGDCRAFVCDGLGGVTTVADDADAAADANECTADGCAAGMASYPPEPAGEACAQDGGTACDGAGLCVACTTGAACPTGVCALGRCQPIGCTDGAATAGETDIDCGGGACAPCDVGRTCSVNADCFSGRCAGTCQPVAVASTSPPAGATNVGVASSISVTFSGPMQVPSLSLKTSLDAGPCSGTIQLSTDGFATCVPFAAPSPTMSAQNTVATLRPAPGLSFGSAYELRVTAGALDALGGAAATFTTPSPFTTELGATTSAAGGRVVISQVYGGGGSAGAPLSHDFIELKNRSGSAVDVTGWSVQYASATGATWQVTPLSGVIPPGGYLLVREGSAGAAGSPLPAPDVIGTINLSATNGKVALIEAPAALSGACPTDPAIVDRLGYGPAASCFEGALPSSALSAGTAAIRGAAGCADTDASASDFASGPPAPRSGDTPASRCPGRVLNETGFTAEVDACRVQGPASLALAPGAPSGFVYGRVLEGGVTEAAGPSPNVLVELGVGPRDENPQHEPGWAWSPAAFFAQAGAQDEYRGSFAAPAAGAYAYAFRTSFDGGLSWTYCDAGGAGAQAGLAFETPRLPQLVVAP
jgi:hypothetical protein